MLAKNNIHIKLASPIGLANIQLTDYYGTGTYITRIYVPEGHRGKGIGSKMLDCLCKMADKEGEILYLEIRSYDDDGLSNEQLEKWYKRKGFKLWMGVYRRTPR